MKKLLVSLMMVAMGLLLMAPVAIAYTVEPGQSIIVDYGIGNANGGGAFNVYKTDNTFLFSTFCVEDNEYFSPGQTLSIGSITTGAINGGIGGPNPDPLSSESAYLYSRWATGAIVNNAANANAVQLAIWKFEEEFTGQFTWTTDAQTMYELADNNANGSLYSVRVMNLYGYGTANGNAQDMLTVPEPTTMLLLGFGLLGLAGIRRFKK